MPRVVLPALGVVGLLLTLVLPRRIPTRHRASLTLVATSLWLLDHVCLSMRTILRESPDLREVRVDVTALPVLDEASIVTLKRAIEDASAARVRLRVDGWDASMKRLLLAHAVSADHLGQPRQDLSEGASTLH